MSCRACHAVHACIVVLAVAAKSQFAQDPPVGPEFFQSFHRLEGPGLRWVVLEDLLPGLRLWDGCVVCAFDPCAMCMRVECVRS